MLHRNAIITQPSPCISAASQLCLLSSCLQHQCGIIIGTFILASTTVQAQDFQSEWQLYTACAPVNLHIRYHSHNEGKLQLYERTIATTVRSRLRAARIYTDSTSTPLLAVTVKVFGNAFSFQFTLIQLLLNLVTNTEGTGATWTVDDVGTHGYRAEYILQAISETTDLFIDEYLAVNEPACK